MSKETFVVAYESEDDSAKLLTYAIDRARKENARLHIVHVLEWSPYSFLTPEEVEERTSRRKKELARAKEVITDAALARVETEGVEATAEIRYGQVVELIVEISIKQSATMIFVGRSGSNSMASRIFGSVPLGLAQLAPVPTVIVP